VKAGKIRDMLRENGIKAEKDYDVKKLTTYKIGGRAAVYAQVVNEEQLKAAVGICRAQKTEYAVFGCFSNVLIKEGRIEKVFIRMKGDFEKISVKKNTVWAGAGVLNSRFLKELAHSGLAGAEFMTGIPGSIGGAVYMNAGAYGKCIGGLVKKIRFMDRAGRMKTAENTGNIFSYRKSIFEKNGGIITEVEMRLKKGRSAEIEREMARIVRDRRSKHPWKDPSAGSVFKNKYPEYTAGKLIQEAGMKGVSIGGARVSRKHANFIINKGTASFKDVVMLIGKIKREVRKKCGITLEEEIRIIK